MADNIILVGPMGAGKSTIGRRLAQLLDWEFIDSDHVIEERTGARISWIFEKEGESGFRDREQAVIADLCQRRRVVLATGGGAVLRSDNRRNIKSAGQVIYLMASVHEQLRRMKNDRQRPLLQTPNPRERLQSLSRERDPLYREVATLILHTDGCHVRQVARTILRRFRPKR